MSHADKDSMSFLEHLEELRWTIIWILVAVAIGSGLVWYFSDSFLEFFGKDLVSILERTLGPGNYDLHVFEVAEAFTTRLKVSLLLGLLVTLPFTIYKVWSFVWPGLLSEERRTLTPLVVLSTLLFYCGVAFAYFVMVKLTVAFLFRLKPPSVVATVRLGSYIAFVSKFCLTFGLVFQVPLVMAFLSKAGLVSLSTLRKGWRHAVVGILVMAAVLTPPDVISQLLMAGPMIALYWLGYGLAAVFKKA